MGNLLSEFVTESDEVLERVASALQEVEKGVPASERIDAIYRDVHTLKGSAQLLGFPCVSRVAHALEACFAPIRKSKASISAPLLESAYSCIDLISRQVRAIAETGGPVSAPADEMQSVLIPLVEAAVGQFGGDFKIVDEPPVIDEVVVTAVDRAKQVGLAAPSSSYSGDGAGLKSALGAPPTPKASTVEQAVLSKSIKSPSPDSAVAPPPFSSMSASVMAAAAAAAGSGGSAVDSSIRVQVELLDRLMNLAGELVLVRNQVQQFSSRYESLEFLNLCQSLDGITTELQSEVMKTRMQPIGNVVGKFQRFARDLGRELGKQIDVTLQGAETELDKTLLEAIKDPLTHIIRNGCDHGIESVSDRKAAGKPSTGHILIRSFHEGGQVVVEVSDDGRGLDKGRIIQKAIERGILTQDKVQRMSDREIFGLVFLPGFTTVQQVSAVSGRGVGMDVVKTNVEKIGGTVELDSLKGKGTSVRLKIPLTLAVVPTLIVRSGGQRFAIPQVKLVELVRVEAESGEARIEFLQNRPMYRLRGDLLPLVDLSGVFSGGTGTERLSSADGSANIVVLSTQGEYFGLVVDEILDTSDIVVKPLSRFLKTLEIFSGATIMGDGSVALILDVMGIAAKAHINTKASSRKDEGFSDDAARRAERAKKLETQEFLVFKTAAQNAHAVPLCLVQRLEVFPASAIEYSGRQQVVRYRGSILPLIQVNSVLGYSPSSPPDVLRPSLNDSESIKVVVVAKSNRFYGLVVEDILDVLEVDGMIDDSVRDREGLLGNLILDQRVIVVVDALGIVDLELIRLGKKAPDEVTASTRSARDVQLMQMRFKQKAVRILYAEDVAFFRKHVSKALSRAGHDSVVVEDGLAAIKALEESNDGDFTLILSDIEMPRMNGLEFARAVRKNSRFKDIPMIALTTRAKDSDMKAGREAGFNLYLEKLNEAKLLEAVDELTQRSGDAVELVEGSGKAMDGGVR